MKNIDIKKLLTTASAAALATFFWSNSNVEKTETIEVSSQEAVVEVQPVEEVVQQEVEEIEVAETVIKPVQDVSLAPAPYFLNSENFKKYDSILYKVVRSPAEKNDFNLSLLDSRSLEDAANYLKNPSIKPGKEEKVYHLKASGFLIKAITAHPLEYEVTAAVKELLAVNLTHAKSQLSLESYTMLKENKAEVLYHALAVSEEIQQSYVAGYDDAESQNLLQKVQDLHASNVIISQEMIADR